MEIKNDILVSIIVVTYNSSKFVLETLESAKNQTYKNIELIISDDCSKDNTVKICEEWLAVNGEFFVESKIITVEQNTGIPQNCNRGIKSSKGVWLKLIAGDDALEDTCVEEHIKYNISNPDVKIVQSLCSAYQDTFEEKNFLYNRPAAWQYPLFDLTAKQQYKQLHRKGNFIYAPSMMVKRDLMIENDLYDERFKFMEDYPLWLKLTSNDIKINFLPKVTVKYRKHSQSVMNDDSQHMNEKFASSNIYFLKTFYAENMDFKTRKEIFRYKIIVALNKLGLNNKSFLSKVLFALTARF